MNEEKKKLSPVELLLILMALGAIVFVLIHYLF